MFACLWHFFVLFFGSSNRPPPVHACIDFNALTTVVILCESLSAFAVYSECGSATHIWYRPMRPCHTSVERTPLVTISIALPVQIIRACLQVSPWTQGAISDRWLSTSVLAGYGRLTSTHDILPRTNTRLGDRSFAVVGPRHWNTLSAELREPVTELVTWCWMIRSKAWTKVNVDIRRNNWERQYRGVELTFDRFAWRQPRAIVRTFP